MSDHEFQVRSTAPIADGAFLERWEGMNETQREKYGCSICGQDRSLHISDMEKMRTLVDQIETADQALTLLYLVQRKFDFTIQTYTPADIRSQFESGAFESDVSKEDVDRIVARIVADKYWTDGHMFVEGTGENLFEQICMTAAELGVELDAN